MIRLDEDALYCDLAEYYGLYEWESIGLLNLATLACGLRDEARIKLKMSKSKIKNDTLLLAGILDRLSLLLYAQTKDAKHNRNRPKMILDMINKTEDKNQVFYTSEDFMRKRKEIINGK